MTKYLRLGQYPATPVSNTQRKEILVKAYVDDKGYIQNAGLTFKPVTALEKGSLVSPKAAVMHRTDSSTASSTLSAFQRGLGTHFLIDKDGTIYQAASLFKQTAHVGPIKIRCLDEGTCPPSEAKKLIRLGPKQGHMHEKNKAYPARYPINEDSVGIEVVAKNLGGDFKWEAPTAAQSESISMLVRILKEQYELTDSDIYEHDKISRKTRGEGAGLYDADVDGLHGGPNFGPL